MTSPTPPEIFRNLTTWLCKTTGDGAGSLQLRQQTTGDGAGSLQMRQATAGDGAGSLQFRLTEQQATTR